MNEYAFYISMHFRDYLFNIIVLTFPSPVFKNLQINDRKNLPG